MFKLLYESTYYNARTSSIFVGCYTSYRFFGFRNCRVFGLKNFYGHHRKNNCFSKRDFRNWDNGCIEQYIGVFRMSNKASGMFVMVL